MNLLSLGIRSLANRRFTVSLTVFTIAISVVLMLGVERIRHNAKTSFANTISGTDLIVGARSGAIQLLLYSVFRIGNATNNISWESYQDIAGRDGVEWTVPISLGDSHRGYRVMGTSPDYFEHYRVGNRRALEFDQGKAFEDLFDVVLGAEVAASLDYAAGDRIVVAHGLGNEGFSQHKDKPFIVSGILAPTGTPVDRTLHVSLEAIEAIHIDWQDGTGSTMDSLSADRIRKMELRPKAITAFLVGLENRIAVFGLQRAINQYAQEPLLAILPGVALQELWSLVRVAETALFVITLFVAVAAFAGMIAVSLAGLNERRREMAILRALGAGYRHIMGLLVVESLLLTFVGIGVGLIVLYTTIAVSQPWVASRFGLFIPPTWPTAFEWGALAFFLVGGMLAGLIPAWKAYRNALLDGLTARV